MTKVNKTIGPLHNLQIVLPGPSLVTIYKSFIRPHIHYEDPIRDQNYYKSFYKTLRRYDIMLQ